VSDYTYAAILVNAYIDALNNLRHCPPLSIAHRYRFTCILCSRIRTVWPWANEACADSFL
jgi:hypothetical protein